MVIVLLTRLWDMWDKFLGIEITYKCVFAFMRNGERYSSMVVTGKALTEYIPNEWVRAPKWLAEKGHGLLAFDDIKYARRFGIGMKGVKIWRCKGKRKMSLPIYCSFITLQQGKLDPYLLGLIWPEGTTAYKEIKLIEEIPFEDS